MERLELSISCSQSRRLSHWPTSRFPVMAHGALRSTIEFSMFERFHATHGWRESNPR